MTTSATARSSPGGLGSAASSVKRSTTSEAMRAILRFLGSDPQDPSARLSAPAGTGQRAREERVPAGRAEEGRGVEAAMDPWNAEADRPDAPVVDLHRAKPDSPTVRRVEPHEVDGDGGGVEASTPPGGNRIPVRVSLVRVDELTGPCLRAVEGERQRRLRGKGQDECRGNDRQNGTDHAAIVSSRSRS